MFKKNSNFYIHVPGSLWLRYSASTFNTCNILLQGPVLCMSKLEETVNDADFIFECIPEDVEMKKDIFESITVMYMY